MKSERKTAMVAGALFIVATVASLMGNSFTGSILGASDYLTRISANGNPIMVGALLTFVAAAASSGIAISLYPVLRRYNEGLALGAVGFRLIEAVFYIVGAVCRLALFTLSQEYVSAGGQGASHMRIPMKSSTDSDLCRPPIPIHAVHAFRFMSSTLTLLRH
jgi:hypothetical protein